MGSCSVSLRDRVFQHVKRDRVFQHFKWDQMILCMNKARVSIMDDILCWEKSYDLKCTRGYLSNKNSKLWILQPFLSWKRAWPATPLINLFEWKYSSKSTPNHMTVALSKFQPIPYRNDEDITHLPQYVQVLHYFWATLYNQKPRVGTQTQSLS